MASSTVVRYANEPLERLARLSLDSAGVRLWFFLNSGELSLATMTERTTTTTTSGLAAICTFTLLIKPPWWPSQHNQLNTMAVRDPIAVCVFLTGLERSTSLLCEQETLVVVVVAARHSPPVLNCSFFGPSFLKVAVRFACQCFSFCIGQI